MKELLRQASHLLFGVGAAALILILDREYAIVFFTFILFIGFLLLEIFTRGYSPPVLGTIMKWLERKRTVPAQGALAFVVGILICIVFFPMTIAAVAVLALGIHDSISTIVGVKYGKHRIYQKKTLEGTLAGMLATTAVLALLIAPLLALITAAATAVIELYSPIDDNLVIPISICLLLWILV
ncbi:MAG: phosphatidate cytidylyltransferase [Methanocalculus sp. MSAO_Arc1]|uniref:diacylglycerol/polyprenol kinase family protein n=1 Tax=Methanocalculus TaxID=71151 RepID=UPI000FF622CA|nr:MULTISPECIES: phosphatidate cytidylyltransferase [unclassified Methanocalculus]MCP1662909.1 dolichol kinase [Methanocalculus sp. AMF5]RQD80382.1 MAG: phosphatidate cytidylyltransferase [Methanocalculus sp. MSAO_Arc1]